MALLLAVLLQVQEEPGARLLHGGWKAVDELAGTPAAKPRLEELAKGADAELAWWAGAALAELDARVNLGGVAPLRVSVEARERPASEVLGEVLARAGLALSAPAEGDSLITLSLRDVPCLQAIDEVCRRGNFTLASRPFGPLDLIPGDKVRGPRSYRGSFSAGIGSLVERSDVTFREPPRSSLSMELVLRSDPSVRVLDLEPACELVEAADDTGRSLLRPDGRRPAARFRGGRDPGVVVDAALEAPDPKARTLARVRGRFTVSLARREETIVFDRVLAGGRQEKGSGPVSAVLGACVREGEEYRVDLEMSSREKILWPETDGLSLEDAQGRPLSRWGSSSSASGLRATYRVSFRSRGAAVEPERLRVRVVTSVFPREVPFELTEVPLR